MTQNDRQLGKSESQSRAIGFWQCWAISVGIMIGSGIFLLPSVLAPYGSISLLGWIATSLGVICLACILGYLSARRSAVGGPYAYTREAFGDLPGFLIGWGYWLSVTLAITAVSLAFAGYLGHFIPALAQNSLGQAGVALALIWTFTAVNIRGVSEAAWVQFVMTILKLIPLCVIIALGVFAGSVDTLPDYNPQKLSVGQAVATTALLTMWAFIGVEAAVIPASDVDNAKRTLPRAVVSGAVTVALIYIFATFAVMMLVPSDVLVTSEAPFVEAARRLGPWGESFLALGALLATAGSLNGNILVAGQMPMAVALDRLAPPVFARRNAGRAPVFSLLMSSLIASVLLVFHLNDSLVNSFTFLITISTLCVLAPYGFSALAALKWSAKSTGPAAKVWSGVALVTVGYMILAASGSGGSVLMWGGLLMALGVPLFYMGRQTD